METFSEDGSINVYTVREGMYIRSIFPATFGSAVYKLDHIELSYQGHVIMAGHSQDVHSMHVYTINGHLLTSRSAAAILLITVAFTFLCVVMFLVVAFNSFSAVSHRITAISTAGDYIITGDENGDLVLRDLLTPKVVQSLALQLPIQVCNLDRTMPSLSLYWATLSAFDLINICSALQWRPYSRTYRTCWRTHWSP